MKAKKYWVQNIRTNEEKVLSAQNLKEVSTRLGWERKLIKICKVWRNKPKSELVLNY